MRVLGSSSAAANHLIVLAYRVVHCGQLHEVRAQHKPRNQGTHHSEIPRLTSTSCSSLYGAQGHRPRQRQRRCAHLLLIQTRAATHWQAAGRTEAAVKHYLSAVHEAAVRGDAQRAYGLAEQALTLLDQLPTTPSQALLRAQLLLEKGCLQWHGALLGAAFTLPEALASLEAAKASLPDDVPPEVVEQLAVATAGICYDVGDQAALQRALAELRESSHRLVPRY